MTDLRVALRTLAKSPGFAVVAVLTFGLGIGAVTTMFNCLRALVIEPLPYPEADRLVHVWSNDGQPLATLDYFDIKEEAHSFAELGGYSTQRTNLGGESPESVRSVSCTPGVLRAFGVAPRLGRLLTDADEEKGAAPVAVISYRLWQRSFAGDPALVGRTIRLNGDPVTVVGIMPADFEFASPWMPGGDCDVLQPLQLDRSKGNRDGHWLCTLGRLRDGVTIASADAEIKAIGARLKIAYPTTNTNKPFLVRPLHFEVTRHYRSEVWMLVCAVALVLLIACANVASMLLARSARRSGEFGVRVALGASRGQIIRLVLTESALLSLGGTVVGIGVAAFSVPLLQSLAPVSEARKAAMELDRTALSFALGLGALCALLSGLPSAFAAQRASVGDLLRVDCRGAAGSRTRHRLLRVLIIAQVGVALLLANGAVLFSAGYARLLSANARLSTDHVISAQFDLRGGRFAKKESRTQFHEELAQRVAVLPGVAAAGVTTKLPLEGGNNMTLLVDDEVFDSAARRQDIEISAVTPAYFAAAGIPLLRGRTLQPGDAGTDEIGVVVNRAFAEASWPGADPIGKVIRPNSPKPWFHARVVGVVDDVRQWGDGDPRPELYWTPDRAWGQSMFLVVRSTQPAASLVPVLRRTVAELDPDTPLSRVRTLRSVLDDATQGQRALAALIDCFMAIALGLVAVGLYGTLSYHVLQRTREIGVRMALGADSGGIQRLVIRQGCTWTAIGVVFGLAGALALTSTLKSMVYGMGSLDPTSLLAAILAVVVAALLACWLPARRAARLNPVEALRAE